MYKHQVCGKQPAKSVKLFSGLALPHCGLWGQPPARGEACEDWVEHWEIEDEAVAIFHPIIHMAYIYTQMLHGAGIFTYITGSFLG